MEVRHLCRSERLPEQLGVLNFVWWKIFWVATSETLKHNVLNFLNSYFHNWLPFCHISLYFFIRSFFRLLYRCSCTASFLLRSCHDMILNFCHTSIYILYHAFCSLFWCTLFWDIGSKNCELLRLLMTCSLTHCSWTMMMRTSFYYMVVVPWLHCG